MEWYVNAADAEAVHRSRHEFAAYLSSHAADGSDLNAAQLVYSELVGNVHRHVGGSAWVLLDWSEDMSVLTVRDVGPGFAPETRLPADPHVTSGRGLFLVRQLAGEITVTTDVTGASVSVELPVRRSVAS